MRPTVLLFDIDGTLITTGGAGRRAIERAFKERFGRADAFARLNFGGMTDPAIVRAGLMEIGRPCDAAAIQDVLDAYIAVLEDEVARATSYRLHDGIERALDAACARSGVAVGLGTGNVQKGAALKLARVGVYERFAFGGFGCDHEDRAELIRVGAARGAERLGVAPGECRVVVIGDTPKDVAAAKANGAECIAVATGSFTAEALDACGADRVYPHLDSPGALAALLSAA